MWKLTFSSIRAQKARFFLTSFAVILGVAFMAGTLVLTDTIQQSYDEIVGGTFRHTDAVVQSRHQVTNDQGQDVRGEQRLVRVEREERVATTHVGGGHRERIAALRCACR